MPKLAWIILCQRAIISAQNTLTLVDVLEEVTLPPPPPDNEGIDKKAVPFLPIRFALVSHWERNDPQKAEQSMARVRMIGPNGKVFGFADFSIDLESFARCRCLTEGPGFPFLGFGTYQCKVQLKSGTKWKTVGRRNFIVQAQAITRTTH